MPDPSPPQAATPRHRAFDVIPRDVVTAWLEGKYAQGAKRPDFYTSLGWMLMLRGCYCYQSHPSAKPKAVEHCGYGLFDLEGGEFYVAGVRLYSGPSAPSEVRRARHPLLWRTEVCKVEVRNHKANLTCIYRLVLANTAKAKPIHKAFQPYLSSGSTSPPYDEPDRPATPLRDFSLRFLTEEFDRAWADVEPVDRSVYGVFQMPLRRLPRGAVEFEGQYRSSQTGNPTGTSKFQRLPANGGSAHAP